MTPKDMSETRPKTEIGHVVMTDRVGYTLVSLEEKLVLDRELLEAVRACPAVIASDPADLILTDSGDGVSMVFFNDPVCAAEAALYLFERVAKTAKVKLRIGIHSGPLMRRVDARGAPNVTGPGIEKAQRTMNQSGGSSVLVSEFFAENLRAFGDWRQRLVDIGERTIKHGDTLRLYSLLTEEATAGALKVALLYKRNSEPGEMLLRALESKLSASGYEVFVDRHMNIGVAWAQEVDRQIRQADVAIPLIGEPSLGSEMLLYEVETAVQGFESKGSPRVIPVRVAFSDPLTGEVGNLLSRFHHESWSGPEDTERLGNELVEAIANPSKAAGAPVAPLEPAGGAVPLESRYYIVRETDDEFQSAMAARDSIVLVKGGRQMGKTSLLARAMRNCESRGSQVVVTDFQSFSSAQLRADEPLYKSLAYELALQLDLNVDIESGWNPWLGANSNFERFLQTKILENVGSHLVWAMDEVDRLFPLSFATDFFGMIRSWHNRRALRPDSSWSKLTIAIAYATEAHLFITDLNQSPFNVGTRLSLSDFNLGHVAELNQRYGRPLQGSGDETRFLELTGGQPYLCRRGLDEMVRRSLSYGQLEAQADQEEGPFGDHLRRILIGVSNDPKLLLDVEAVLKRKAPSVDGFYRLRSAGVLTGDSPETARLRCKMYETYLLRHTPSA